MYEDYFKPAFWGALILVLTGTATWLLAKATFFAAIFENKYYLFLLPVYFAVWIVGCFLLIKRTEKRLRRW
ncbi:hypothetical protein [Rhizobium mongolense]|uniref:Uncharacterized protein n=1 Tax=Rhizobium mongolense TaxID=57676 RepID=A0A7W6RW09_9HYPH|nr:hypothetical protein [Rhizobium mongolense]MBB4278928.1 hypothetical protein [Rhizobium mongolense]